MANDMAPEGVRGPKFINARFMMTLLEINDVAQTARLEFVMAFYYEPNEPVQYDGLQKIRFENIHPPIWQPNFDFANEFDELKKTHESYWYDQTKNRVFGRIAFLPFVQERFDHSRFPFDRQILDVQTLFDNCQIDEWRIFDEEEYPPELQLRKSKYISQIELGAASDSWRLVNLATHCLNDIENKSCILMFQISLQRHSQYYFWNIVFVYFAIIASNSLLYAFPYTEARFDFALTLALTTVAFKFVISELVPKTAYLTYLDYYLLFGLLVLAARFLNDFLIQLYFVNILPLGPDAVRIPCEAQHENENGYTACDVDFAVTVALFTVWNCVFILMFVGMSTNLLRNSWRSLNKKIRVGSRQAAVVRGNEIGEWAISNRSIRYNDFEDLTSSIRVEGSEPQLSARGKEMSAREKGDQVFTTMRSLESVDIVPDKNV